MILDPYINSYYAFKKDPSPKNLQALVNWLRDHIEMVDDRYWPVFDDNLQHDGVIIRANPETEYEYIPKHMTVRQLSKVTGTSRARIYQLLKAGKLTLPLTIDQWLLRVRGKAGRPTKYK